MRSIQNFHMDSRGWSDIAYSFVIDPVDLTIYEARGAGVLGGHTFGRNSISHAICIMGNFDREQPTPALIDRIAELVAYGHARGWWPKQLTGGHRDVRSTSCPGTNLYRQIPTINLKAKGGDMPNKDAFLEDILASLNYTVKKDGSLDEQELANFANMRDGIRKLITDREDLEQRIADLEMKLSQVEADAALGRQIRALVAGLG